MSVRLLRCNKRGDDEEAVSGDDFGLNMNFPAKTVPETDTETETETESETETNACISASAVASASVVALASVAQEGVVALEAASKSAGGVLLRKGKDDCEVGHNSAIVDKNNNCVHDMEEALCSMSMTSSADGNTPNLPAAQLQLSSHSPSPAQHALLPALRLDGGGSNNNNNNIASASGIQKAHSDGGSTTSMGTRPSRAYSDGGESYRSTRSNDTVDTDKESLDRNHHHASDTYSSVGVGSIAQALGSWNISMEKDERGETVLFVQRGDSKVALRFDQNAIKVADSLPAAEGAGKDDASCRIRPPASPVVRRSTFLESVASKNGSPMSRVRRSGATPDRSKSPRTNRRRSPGSPITGPIVAATSSKTTPRRRSSPLRKSRSPLAPASTRDFRQRHRFLGASVPFRVVPIDDQSSPQIRPMSLGSARERSSSIDSAGSEKKISSGRWTDQEHQRFLRGLNVYGKDWKKISAYIETRDREQTRTHAQKYFRKIARLCEKHDADVPADLLSTAKDDRPWEYGEHDLRKLPITALDPSLGRKKYTCPIRATQPMSPARFETSSTPACGTPPTLFEALKVKPRRRSSSISSYSSDEERYGTSPAVVYHPSAKASSPRLPSSTTAPATLHKNNSRGGGDQMDAKENASVNNVDLLDDHIAKSRAASNDSAKSSLLTEKNARVETSHCN